MNTHSIRIHMCLIMIKQLIKCYHNFRLLATFANNQFTHLNLDFCASHIYYIYFF